MTENFKEAKILSDEEIAISDSLQNLVAQLGTDKDKRSHSKFVNNKQLSKDGNQIELNAMYRTDALSGKIIDIIPDDMTREWRKFKGDIDPELVKDIEAEENRLQLREKINEAHKWGRLYGTGFVVITVDDGLKPDEPLDISRIKEGSLQHIHAIDTHRIDHSEVQPVIDPMDKNFGMPELYRFRETSTTIHHTRMLRFDGIKLPFDEFRRNNYRSDSVLSRLYETITNFNTATDSSASMIYETNVDVMKVKGLMNYLASADGQALVTKRFALAKTLKSFNNMLLLDSEEDFETKSNTFAGLHNLLDKFSLFLSAASDIPATRLLGSSASGFNATGEGDLKNYYDTIRSAQIRDYKPRLDYFDKIMFASMGIKDEEAMEYEFSPLFQMTPKEISDMNLVDAQRDALYVDRSIVTEATVAKELVQNKTYTNITEDHIKDLEGLEDDFDSDTDNNEFGTEQETQEREEEKTEPGENT